MRYSLQSLLLSSPLRALRGESGQEDAPDGWLSPGAGPGSGALTRRVDLAAGASKDIEISFMVPVQERWGLHRMTLILRERGTLVARLPVHVHIEGPKGEERSARREGRRAIVGSDNSKVFRKNFGADDSENVEGPSFILNNEPARSSF